MNSMHTKLLLLAGLWALLGACTSSIAANQREGERGSSARVKATICVETNPHPVAQNIAAKYEVSYEQVVEWFCGGSNFDDILLALETRKLTDIPVEDLLARAEKIGWEQLWVETGLTEPMEPEATH